METLEERNLNRLRNGKMMLEFSKIKRSYLMTFVMAGFFAGLGVHRFYLGHIKLGLMILILTIGMVLVVGFFKLKAS